MLRVAVTGPESTGKSELASQLALHYQTLWVPEVARDYLNHLERGYIFEDVVKIAKAQYKLENSLARQARKILFCDTDLLVTKIWSTFKFGKCDPWIEEKVISHRYDLYLLCNIDLPWVEDPLREHPSQREELFGIYLEELQRMNVPYIIISGTGGARTANAILAVEEALSRIDLTPWPPLQIGEGE